MRWLDRLLGRAEYDSRIADAYVARRSPQADDGLPFRFLVEDVFVITGRGTVVVGTVQSGAARVGDPVLVGSTDSVVDGIEVFGSRADQTITGEPVGLLLRGVTRDSVARGGQVLGRS
ncbi:translation elongation factor EF-Tu-like GTPase [Conyzicola lurida]|uniref:Translation elongation factor EF-Tu-like GTPase n=1 Tax=Conyzicola lurida TaxID=1172621 RepID=A0A841ARJ7_9MICO|nr:EF-Tu/IF-2/RF-3 family GTPase [Conyzicola lurida]MBB5844195.1 translation elongation factor EF-Tu-like GTPase [Conyzicola lurida]